MSLEELKEKAKRAAQNSYAAYSGFKVGSAILLESGEVITGCNIESDSLTFNICAERNAISTAISQIGNVKIDTVVIYADSPTPAAPCGVCRQLIYEFGHEARIVSYGNANEIINTNIQELLPHAFDFNEFKK
ncbi:MAG: cytidine deaminase [Flavobacteriales bacterium]|nr:cytidine deaminase [Flavobacteriales bacterium]